MDVRVRLSALATTMLVASLVSGCSEAGSDSPETSSKPLWQLLAIHADYDIVDSVDRLVKASDTEHTVSGRIIAADIGASYTVGGDTPFESAYLTVAVSSSDQPGLEKAVVEVYKPAAVGAAELSAATFGDDEVVILIKTEPLFPTKDVVDLDAKPEPENLYSVSSGLMGALVLNGDVIRSLTTHDVVLKDSKAKTTGQLVEEISGSLS